MAAACYVLAAVVCVGIFLPKHSLANSNMCAQSCSCLSDFVDCSGQGLVEIPKDLPSFVSVLDLKNNAISVLSQEDFRGLRNLTKLDLSNNGIESLNEDTFEHLTSLTELKLNKNKITEVPKLRGLSSLAVLELNKNLINDLALQFLTHMPALRTLELNNNQIGYIVAGMFHAGNALEKLTMNGNSLVEFEKGCLDNLTALETLKMNRNAIISIPQELFRNLTNLRTLEMSKNRLRTIDGLIFHKQSKLTILKLQKNSIVELKDGAFYGLNKLQELHIDHNNISEVDKRWLYGLKSLRQLFVNNNRVHRILDESLNECETLQKLEMSNNHITSINSNTFSKLYQLQSLYLNSNEISNIDDGAFRDLASLELLELNNNAISWTIEDMNGAFEGLLALTKLGLENNKIKSIARNAFDGLTNVRVLNLLNNDINSIQRNALEPMGHLEELLFNTSSLLCDCQLKWLPTWLRNRRFDTSVRALCAHPMSLKGKSIFTIDLEEFRCEGEFLHPVMTVDPKSQIALKGENLTLNCSAASTKQSHPIFRWKKDNVLLQDPVVANSVKRGENIVNYTSQLFVNNIKHSDAGRYQCIITNEFGSAYSAKADITVHVFPQFIKKPVDITERAGNTARLECAAIGSPKPNIAWKKNGDDVIPAAIERRMHVMSNDDVFFIMEVNSRDEGVYSCTAKNAAGMISANATLKVLEVPSFVRDMEKTKIATKGETAVLECMASGSPQPKLTWLKDGRELEANKRYFLAAKDQLLIIVETEVSDEGVYTCVMTNTVGTEKGFTRLRVYSPRVEAREETVSTEQESGPSDESTTTGIIIIAVVCCVVGTSLVWVIIIYQTRKRQEMYSATPTDETTLPTEMYSSGYNSTEKDVNYAQKVPLTATDYHYLEYQMKESGYESSSGRFRAARAAAIFPSDVNEDEHQRMPLTMGECQGGEESVDNSESGPRYSNSDTDSVKSSQSTSSTRASEQQMMRTFHPLAPPQDTLISRTSSTTAPDTDCGAAMCDTCEQCQSEVCADLPQYSCVGFGHSLYSNHPPVMALPHGTQPQPPGHAHLPHDVNNGANICDRSYTVGNTCQCGVISPYMCNSLGSSHIKSHRGALSSQCLMPGVPLPHHTHAKPHSNTQQGCNTTHDAVHVDSNPSSSSTSAPPVSSSSPSSSHELHCKRSPQTLNANTLPSTASSENNVPPAIPPKQRRHSSHSKLSTSVQQSNASSPVKPSSEEGNSTSVDV